MFFALLLVGLLLGLSALYLLQYHILKARATKKVKAMDLAASNKWQPAFLEEKRSHTDPLADETVAAIMRQHEEGQVNHLYRTFEGDSDQLPADAPEELKKYFKQSSVLPAWADPDLLAFGQQVYLRQGAWISLLLSYKSLPECYACAKGAEVLFHTGRLNEQNGSLDAYSRRIAETAQFVLYAMSPGGLAPSGRGLRATQKVRLIHAIIRYFLKQKNWNTSAFDEPINQEDMAGTLMSFSALVLEGMETLGIKLDTTEKEAYVHCWRVIGHIVGLHDNLIPRNSQDALKLGHAILDNQIAPGEHSRILMKALVDFQNNVSGRFMGNTNNIAMMRLMMGDGISDQLGVPPVENSRVEKLKRRIRTIIGVAEFMERTLIFAGIVHATSRMALQFVVSRMTSAKIINFYLPKSLTRDQGVSAKQT